jgi:hypothetical protein
MEDVFVLAPLYNPTTRTKVSEVVIITSDKIALKIVNKFPAARIIHKSYALKIAPAFGYPNNAEEQTYLESLYCGASCIYGLRDVSHFFLDN